MGRLGGDEFLVVLKHANQEQACDIAEQIRADIHDANLAEIVPIELTVSIGVVSCQGQKNLDEAIAQADNLLYQAKENGRNIVVSANKSG